MRLAGTAVCCWLMVMGLLGGAQSGRAQAPAGSTGQCNDGSYTSAAKKWQACRGHQGVKSWFAEAGGAAPASAAAPAMTARPAGNAPTPAQTPSAAASAPTAATPSTSGASAAGKRQSPAQRAANTPQAAGGGGGKVWVNTETKVYHCEGSTFYGKTKAGQYMTEAEAKAAGARPDRNRPCAK